jgi:hypothetical protein
MSCVMLNGAFEVLVKYIKKVNKRKKLYWENKFLHFKILNTYILREIFHINMFN